MDEKRRTILLAPILAMTGVGLAATLVSLVLLYNVEFDNEAARLRTMAQSQARLIEAVARFDQAYSNDYPEGAWAATLSQFVAAHREFEGFGETGSFIVGMKKDDHIVFLLANRRFDRDTVEPIPWNSDIAEPMRLALSGKSGVMIGADDRGRMVLAAHEPIAVLDLGIVAETDISEIRAPFIKTGIAIAAIIICLIAFSVAVFQRVTAPLLQKMIHSREEAVEASRAKSSFLANMSHELCTPLNAVIGFSDMMRHQVLGPLLPESYRDYVEDIHGSAQHLLGIVSEILDMSKIEAGKYILFKEPVDVGAVVGEALAIVRWRAESNRVELTTNLPGGLPRLVADRRAMKQVLINLITNAIKFTPPGGKVTVEASGAGPAMTLSVSDTGIGITPEDITRVLQPFVQAERERNRSHEGTGLGLPLSKALVEMHGGTMILESVVGRGTRVSATIPLDDTSVGERSHG